MPNPGFKDGRVCKPNRKYFNGEFMTQASGKAGLKIMEKGQMEAEEGSSKLPLNLMALRCPYF